MADLAVSKIMAEVRNPAPGRWVIPAMDTMISVNLPGIVGDSLIEAIVSDLRMVEQKLSVFRPDSEICSWRAGLIPDSDVSPELAEVIDACSKFEKRSGGLFSPWRDGEFDPTGYVKGWALRRITRIFEQAGIDSYELNGGGDVVVLGRSPDGQPWRIGVAHPYRPGELATIITAAPGQEDQPLAVATSGTSQRGSHIVNPLDGWRPGNGAVTVLGHDIAVVDAAATAVLAAGQPGPTAQIAVVSDLGLEAFGFSESRTPWWTPGMTRYALLPALASCSTA